MLELREVSKNFVSKKGGVSYPVLQQVSARFERSQFVAIVGPSGSGKSSLLNVISGLDRSFTGEVLVEGVPVQGYSERNRDALRAQRIGILRSNGNLIDRYNVLDNVISGLAAVRVSGAKAKTRAMDALAQVGMVEFAKARLFELTPCQLQLVALARSIAKNPSVILADEPTGSMDSASGQSFMEVLKSVGQGRLVILATHNSQLAQKYATSLYSMLDGQLTPVSLLQAAPDHFMAPAELALQRKRVSLSRSFSYVFHGFKKHKFRTALTVASSSLGVLAIALVLAFSTGLTNYVNFIEDSMLSSTPVYISQYKGNSQTATADTSSEDTAKETARSEYLQNAVSNRRVALNNTIATLLSSNGTQSSDEESATLLNDVASLKAYLDTNPENINAAAASIEYTYNTSPVIYSTANGAITEVSPGSMFGSVGSSSGSKKTISSASVFSNLLDFKSLPESTSAYQDAASLVEGHWPTNSGECVLVLNSDGTMDDTLAYTLGLKNFSEEIAPLLEKYKNGEPVEYPGIYDSYAYSDIVGITYKVINPAEVYKKNGDGVWEDLSSDTETLSTVVNNGKDLTIVGVVKPAAGSKTSVSLNEGIYYYPSLNYECMEAAAASQIVQEQLDNPEVDVFTGKTFAWLKQASTITERFDFSSIININADMLASCVELHPEVLDFGDEEGLEETKAEVAEEVALTDEQVAQILLQLLQDPEFQQFIEDLSSSPNFDADVQAALAQAGAAYTEYCAEEIMEGYEPETAEVYFSEKGEGYAWTLITQSVLPESMQEDVAAFTAKYATRISNYILQVMESEIGNLLTDLQNSLIEELNNADEYMSNEEEYDGPSLIEFDEEKFANAIKINITEDDLNQIGHYLMGNTSHTYASNLSTLGYASKDEPITCSIYPNSLADKDKITSILDNYNAQNRANDHENKVVAYSDVMGTLVDVVLAAISAIGGILVVFVSVSLVWVFLMMAIICGVSTLQQARELGILRALGACRGDIRRLVNSEATVIGLLSGLIGCGIAAIVCTAFNESIRQTVNFSIAQLTPAIVIGLIVASTFIAVIAGLIPALWASKKDPLKELGEN